jgi:hypothetical protein
LSALLLAALLAGACEPTAAALPRLTDPTEVLEEALRTTAELEYVHARLDATMEMGEFGGGPSSIALDADIDLGRRELHASMDGGGMGLFGSQRMEMVLVGSDLFSRTDLDTVGAGRWQRMAIPPGSDPRTSIPPTPAIAVALKTLLTDPSVEAELRGVEACGESQCYHVVTTVAPDLIWRAVNGGLFGAPPGQDLGPVDPTIPAVVLDIMVEESTRRLISVASAVTLQGTSVDVSVTLRDHDVEFRILPPPANEVDDIDDNTGGFGEEERILEEVGEELEEGGD